MLLSLGTKLWNMCAGLDGLYELDAYLMKPTPRLVPMVSFKTVCPFVTMSGYILVKIAFKSYRRLAEPWRKGF